MSDLTRRTVLSAGGGALRLRDGAYDASIPSLQRSPLPRTPTWGARVVRSGRRINP